MASRMKAWGNFQKSQPPHPPHTKLIRAAKQLAAIKFHDGQDAIFHRIPPSEEMTPELVVSVEAGA